MKSSCAQIESQQTLTGQTEIYSSSALLEIPRNPNFNNWRNTHFNCWSSTEEIIRGAFNVNSNKKSLNYICLMVFMLAKVIGKENFCPEVVRKLSN